MIGRTNDIYQVRTFLFEKTIHSSEIRSLCLMKWPREFAIYLEYWNSFFNLWMCCFSFIIFPNECSGLCWEILKWFARSFHQTWISYFWRVYYYYCCCLVKSVNSILHHKLKIDLFKIFFFQRGSLNLFGFFVTFLKKKICTFHIEKKVKLVLKWRK